MALLLAVCCYGAVVILCTVSSDLESSFKSRFILITLELPRSRGSEEQGTTPVEIVLIGTTGSSYLNRLFIKNC